MWPHPARATLVLLGATVLIRGSLPTYALKQPRPSRKNASEVTAPCQYFESRACYGGACLSNLTVAGCTEPVPLCKKYIPRVEGFALLLQNANYRLSDILKMAGYNWRSSLLSVLSSPVFRGTMMRNISLQWVTLNGTKLADLVQDEYDLEQRVLWESNLEGGYGYFCNLAATAAGALSVPQIPPSAVGAWVKDAHDRGNCLEKAAPEELVVSIRMGDIFEPLDDIFRNLDAALKAKPFIKTVVFSGVLHFSGHRGGDYTGATSNAIVKQNFDKINMLRRRYEGMHLTVRTRSEPVADDDLCFLAYAPHVLQSCPHQGWCSVVTMLRSGLGAGAKQLFTAGNETSDWILF